LVKLVAFALAWRLERFNLQLNMKFFPCPACRIARRLYWQHAEILSPDALEVLAALHRQFNRSDWGFWNNEKSARKQLMKARCAISSQTKLMREGDWRVLPVRPDLQNRRVEISGPVTERWSSTP